LLAPQQAAAFSAPHFAKVNEYEGIAGWLILFGCGLVLSPLLIMRTIYTVNLPFLYDNKHWTLLSSHPAIAVLIVSEVTMNVLFIICLLYLNYLFFMKKREFPRWMILYRVLHLFLLFITHMAFWALDPSADLARGSAAIARSLLGALIWIPYLLLSRRVKATFVN
jgi:hypothetical protein